MKGINPSKAVARLAAAASATRWRDAPEPVRRQTLALIADTFAVIAAGGADPSLQPVLARMAGEAGRSTAVGMANGVPVATAALFNGAATTVLQLQDGHRIARGHPMSHVLPAAFAVAEDIGAATEDFLSAVVAGYEVCARIGKALGGLQTLLHDTGTFGAIGAAVATAHLLSKGDAACLAEAIEGSAAVALFPYRDTAMAGATVHHLYVGLGAANGVTAGKAAAFGLTGLSGTLETFFGPRAGTAFNAAVLTDGVGDGGWTDYELMQAYFKLHPTCAHLNGVNDAVRDLLSSGVSAAEIATIDVAIYGYALEYNVADPQNDFSARFSIPYAAAIAFVTGPLTATSINQAVLADPAVRDLAARVIVRHDPELDSGYPAGRPTTVSVAMRDGTKRSAKTAFPRGDSGNPLSDEERDHKVLALLGLRFGAAAAQRILRLLKTLPDRDRLKDLGLALRGQA